MHKHHAVDLEPLLHKDSNAVPLFVPELEITNEEAKGLLTGRFVPVEDSIPEATKVYVDPEHPHTPQLSEEAVHAQRELRKDNTDFAYEALLAQMPQPPEGYRFTKEALAYVKAMSHCVNRRQRRTVEAKRRKAPFELLELIP